jgi:hypothetical protein
VNDSHTLGLFRLPGRLGSRSLLGRFFAVAGVAHLLFGVAGFAVPRWFYASVPPWPPLHVGQIQIAGVFDLALATGFFVAARDVDRFAPLMLPIGVVAEWGHAAVRIGHIVAGDNPAAGWAGPAGCSSSGASASWRSAVSGRRRSR